VTASQRTLSSPEWTGGWTGERFAHEAFVFSDDDEVRARVVPFVEEGLSREEPVIVIAGDPVRAVLAADLGPRTDELAVFASAHEFWVGGHDTLTAFQRSMEPMLATGSCWRLVDEPVWLAQSDGEAWSRFEAVANDAFAHYPLYDLCLHDRRRLRPELVERQLRAHPLLWDGEAPAPCPDYEPTVAFLQDVEPAWSPVGRDVRTLAVDDLVTGPATVAAWMDLDRVRARPEDVRLAVHEVVLNAVQAAGRAEVSQWHDDAGVVWQVRDHGPGIADQAAGYVLWMHDLDSPRGLWTARSLADDSSLRSTRDGTTIQLRFRADPT
jgi:anti-sigma regulatory factor (Ser/Thr protein kinase)